MPCSAAAGVAPCGGAAARSAMRGTGHGRRPPNGATLVVPARAAPQAGVITDLVLLWTVGIRPVLVHGGGPEINSWLEKLGIQPEFKNGLRVTDGACRRAAAATLASPCAVPEARSARHNVQAQPACVLPHCGDAACM